MAAPLYLGTRKGLFTLHPVAESWEVAHVSFLGVPVTAVLPDGRDGSVYAAVGHGHFGAKLHRSRDGGESWQEITAPKYPEKPKDADDRCPMRNVPIPWNVELIWTLEAADMALPGTLWCGTIPGGLFRSNDAGASWSLNRSLWDMPDRKKWFGGGYDYPGIHSITVDPRDARRVIVGVSCGGAWLTEDEGESWQPRAQGMYAAFMPPERKYDQAIQDAHRIVRCRSAPDVLWAQHHNGVFRSTDEGKNWMEVTTAKPSTFGFAVALHPKDPKTAWLVPAVKDELRVPVDGKMVVSRTRDGGDSFQLLTEGLPQTHAYDLVYRHGLDVDGEGQALAMGSTTGSLWVSKPESDAWTPVSQHLPPIYCVRFGSASR